MNLYELFSKCLSIPYAKVGISANYAVVRKDDTLELYFQDSDGIEDWKSNLDFPAKAYKRMGKTIWFAHRGFLKAWKEIEPYITSLVLDKSVKKIVICGYSHGAALAVLCHEYVWYHHPDIRKSLEGYGFGCPRVFWGIKTAQINKRWESFTVVKNIDDIVTRLPPKALGYSHVGKMLKIGKKGKYSPIEAHYSQNILKELKAYEEGK